MTTFPELLQKLNKVFFNTKSLIIISLLLAIALSFLSQLILLLLIFLISLYGILFYNQKLILAVIIISYLAFTSEFYEEYRIYITAFATILLILLFIKEYGFQTEKFVKVPREILWFLSLLVLTLTLSSIFSSYPFISLTATIRMFIFLLISYLFYALLKDERNIYTYIYSIVGVVLILGIPMIMDLYILGFKDYFVRILLRDKFDLYGSKGYTGFTIFFISISLLTAMFFKNKFKSKKHKYLLFCLLIFNIMVLILASSRGGIFAALVSITFFFGVIKPKAFAKTFLAVSVVVAIIYLTIPTLNEVINNYMRWETLSDREVYWKMGLDVINDFPVFGIGPDLFDRYFYYYAPSTTISLFQSEIIQVGKPHPHNFFLYFTAENGILGLLTSIAFFVLFFYIAFQAIQLTKNSSREYYILSIAITGIGFGEISRSFIEISGHLTYGLLSADLPFWLVFVILVYIKQKFSRPFINNLQ